MTTWESAEGRLQRRQYGTHRRDGRFLPCYGIIGGRCTCGGAHAEPKDVGKHPSIPEWNTRATSDLETINNWYTQAPENNIGVHCQASGFFVIDIDPRSGGPESFEKFESLLDGALPPTVEAITGNYSYKGGQARGRHLFYKCDDNEGLLVILRKMALMELTSNTTVMFLLHHHVTSLETAMSGSQARTLGN
jgi:hypothetical protein